MTDFPITDRNRVRRVPKRAAYDRDTVYAIVDAGMICHVGLAVDGQPVVIPTIHARDGDTLLLHGASTSRLLKTAGDGVPLCVTVTHLDGLVLARSVFNHSMNYRSAVMYGQGYLIDDPDEKLRALEIFTEKLIPGRWQDARQPNATEIKATAVVAVPIESASAKVRTGPPVDDEEDYALPVWAGVLPQRTQYGPLEADPRLTADPTPPDYLQRFVAEQNED